MGMHRTRCAYMCACSVQPSCMSMPRDVCILCSCLQSHSFSVKQRMVGVVLVIIVTSIDEF
jgi:hypothetical protein